MILRNQKKEKELGPNVKEFKGQSFLQYQEKNFPDFNKSSITNTSMMPAILPADINSMNIEISNPNNLKEPISQLKYSGRIS